MNRVPLSIFQRLLCAAIITLSLPLLVYGQQSERVVDWLPIRIKLNDRALEITDIRVEGKSITAGQPFAANDDWLETLTFRVRNISGKTVTIFGFGVAFPEL